MRRTEGANTSVLGRITAAEFAAYFHHLAVRVERAALSVSSEQFYIGQMSYLVQALKTSTGEPPVW